MSYKTARGYEALKPISARQWVLYLLVVTKPHAAMKRLNVPEDGVLGITNGGVTKPHAAMKRLNYMVSSLEDMCDELQNRTRL